MASKKKAPISALTPFDETFWDAPSVDRSRRGDPSCELIYLSVGAALSAWEDVEEVTSQLFIMMIGTADGGVAGVLRRVFGAIPVNSARWQALEAAAEFTFGTYWQSPIGQPKFSKIKRAVLAASRRRNEIAHGRAVLHAYEDNEGQLVGAYLVAPEYNTDRNNLYGFNPVDIVPLQPSKYRYIAEDINLFTEEYKLLKHELWTYAVSNFKGENGLSPSLLRHLIEQK